MDGVMDPKTASDTAMAKRASCRSAMDSRGRARRLVGSAMDVMSLVLALVLVALWIESYLYVRIIYICTGPVFGESGVLAELRVVAGSVELWGETTRRVGEWYHYRWPVVERDPDGRRVTVEPVSGPAAGVRIDLGRGMRWELPLGFGATWGTRPDVLPVGPEQVPPVGATGDTYGGLRLPIWFLLLVAGWWAFRRWRRRRRRATAASAFPVMPCSP